MTVKPVPPEMIRNERVTQFGRQLEAIPLQTRGKVLHNPVPWFFTNDDKYTEVIPGMVEALTLQRLDSKLRIPILAGWGGLSTIAGALPLKADAFVVVDVADHIFNPIQRMIEAFRKTNSPEECMREYDAEKYFDEMRTLGVDPGPYWDIERASFGGLHILSSLDNFQKSKRALTAPVFYSHGNLEHPPYIEALRSTYERSNAWAPYLSVTDLAEWNDGWLGNAAQLPITDETVISWATNNSRPNAQPVARASVGVLNYVVDAKKAKEGTNVDYHKQFI